MAQQIRRISRFSRALITFASLAVFQTIPVTPTDATDVVQDQRIEIVIQESTFLLTKPAAIRLGLPTVIVLRNEDIIKHGFTSQILLGLLVHAEGEGIGSYGKGVEGFYVDPRKTLVIRFMTERPGSYTFRCDLHPQMKGEFLMLDVPVV
jgi:plastocyanin